MPKVWALELHLMLKEGWICHQIRPLGLEVQIFKVILEKDLRASLWIKLKDLGSQAQLLELELTTTKEAQFRMEKH
jgi:hypothetical protein